MRQYAHGMLSDKGLGIWWFDKELHGLQDQVFTGQQKGSRFFFKFLSTLSFQSTLRACLHECGAPQVGEVARLGGVTRLSI